MLPEEALIVVLAFGAFGLLLLGLWNYLSPTRPKHPVPHRQPAAPHVPRPHRQSALQRHGRDRQTPAYTRRVAPLAPLKPALRLATTPAEARGEPVVAEPAALEWVASLEPTAVELEPKSVKLEAAPVQLEAAPLELEATPVEPVSATALPAEGQSIVEICFALYQEQRFSEVLDRAADALTAGGDGRPLSGPQETAALWSVVALARQALGEDTAARTALENAIAAAPERDRPTYERQLASLAQTVAEGLLAEAQRHGKPDTDNSLGLLRSAVAWLERGATAAPNDDRLDDLLASARAVLWPAWERTVVALAQRQDFRAARRLLREALAEPSFPAARAETFMELFSGTFSGEVGQLTAQAIRSMQEARESDALASLRRAETLLDTLNTGALSPGRREEVDRRLWWGYNKLGARRVESGDHESALEPLFHALGYQVGPARRQETVALLVRALEGVTDACALAIRERADSGDREAAIVRCDKLWTQLRGATEMGLTQADLTATFAKVQRLFESLGARRDGGRYTVMERTKSRRREMPRPGRSEGIR
ncbi:MAG TPA: hypothetical protein VFW70_18115 [Methylomirabilota bacterium]|nr:hypothetical protein [Methylomirabilota bacterium]